MSSKVAVVTGANKGIGFAIVRGLCKRFDGVVLLTSRDIERGKKAVAELEEEGLHPKYHQLDVTDKQSLEEFKTYIQDTYKGIDILVNNAGIAFKHDATESVFVQAEQTLLVNYFSMISTCETLFPLLNDGARVINLSSSCGQLGLIPSQDLRLRIKTASSVPELSKLMQQYLDAAKQGTQAEEWGNSSYIVSKVAVTALSIIQQIMLANKNITVNAVHPGYVDTDLSSHKGPLTIDEGAVAPLYLALDAPDTIKGKLVWLDKNIVDWAAEKPLPLV